jgi:excinuclease ABC subunit C
MAEENAALALQTHLLSRDSRRQVVMEDLQRSLDLPGLPHRIEGFDISNIQGTEAVGSMVVWEAEKMKKGDYKRFRIRTVPGADDYAMMAEVLRRRYGKALEEGTVLPDLVMLDGGRGQLNVGVRILEELGLDFIPIVSLAKREEEVYHPESLHPLVLDPASPALHTLQRIRDEAHRFAITYHKTLRQKRTLTSVLDRIPGVGPTLRTNLLRHLGSARKVREASVAELAAVPKITPRLAQRIWEFFHPKPEPAPVEAETGPKGDGAPA